MNAEITLSNVTLAVMANGLQENIRYLQTKDLSIDTRVEKLLAEQQQLVQVIGCLTSHKVSIRLTEL